MNNENVIRVIYKKSGQIPEIKIIKNVFKLKKTIIDKSLEIVPYENVFIICRSSKFIEYVRPNIVMLFNSIYGDLILIKIDKNKREFKGLSQEEIMCYMRDLINKSSKILE